MLGSSTKSSGPGLSISYGHPADIAWREELASVAAEIGADDFFVGFTLHVDITLQQRPRLELGDDVGEYPEALAQ